MFNMALRLIYYYAIVIIVLAISFFVGYTLLSVVKPVSQKSPQTLFSFFSNTLIGLIVLVSIYSIVITSGKTVSWLYIILLFGYGYFGKLKIMIDNTPIISKCHLKFGLSLLVVSLVLYLIYLSALFDFRTLRFTDTFCDWQFYSKTSQYLNLGFESTTQFDNIAFGGSFTPYHYFEIWLAAIISKIFSIPSQIATSILMPTVFGCIAYIGVFGFATKLNYKNALLAFLLLFISSVTFFSSFLNKIGISLPLEVGNVLSVVSYFKLYPIYIFFLFSLHHILHKNLVLMLLCLLFIPVASFVTAPTIIPLVIIITTYFLIANKFKYFRFSFFLTIYLLIFACYYFLIWSKLSTDTFITFSGIWVHFRSIRNPLLMLFNTSPFFVFIFYFNKNINICNELKSILFISFSILCVVGIIIVVLTVAYFDGIQFFTNVFIPSTAAIISLFFLRINKSNYILSKIVFALFIIILCSSVFFSVRYMYSQKKIKEEISFIDEVVKSTDIDKDKIVKCGFIHSKTFYSGRYMSTISNVFRVGEVIDTYKGNFLQVGLSDYEALKCCENQNFEDNVTKNYGFSRIAEGTFYKFVEMQKKEGKFKSIESSQNNFINQFKIDYIFIQKDASVSSQLSSRILLLVSEKNGVGYSFYKICR
jgi:hypothetical protein